MGVQEGGPQKHTQSVGGNLGQGPGGRSSPLQNYPGFTTNSQKKRIAQVTASTVGCLRASYPPALGARREKASVLFKPLQRGFWVVCDWRGHTYNQGVQYAQEFRQQATVRGLITLTHCGFLVRGVGRGYYSPSLFYDCYSPTLPPKILCLPLLPN